VPIGLNQIRRQALSWLDRPMPLPVSSEWALFIRGEQWPVADFLYFRRPADPKKNPTTAAPTRKLAG
jgi:hypothetical protein